MNTIKLTFIILVGLITFASQGHSQSSDNYAKNSIHGSAGFVGLGGGLGLNYERLLRYNPDRGFLNHLSVRVTGGTWVVWDTAGKLALVGITGLSGKKKHRLETMLGITAAKNDNLDIQSTDILLAAGLGYRFQKHEGGFVFRTGLGYPEGLYLGLGYAF